jgi:hypothetical protein
VTSNDATTKSPSYPAIYYLAKSTKSLFQSLSISQTIKNKPQAKVLNTFSIVSLMHFNPHHWY